MDEVTCTELLHGQSEQTQPDKVRTVSWVPCNHTV